MNEPTQPDGRAIQQLVSSFMRAWNQHDAHAFAESFAEDADFTNVRGAGAHGRNSVEKLHAPAFETILKKSQLIPADIRTRFIAANIASVDVRWEMTGVTESDGTPLPPRKGLLNWLVTNEGGRWLIKVMHNQEFTPPKSEYLKPAPPTNG